MSVNVRPLFGQSDVPVEFAVPLHSSHDTTSVLMAAAAEYIAEHDLIPSVMVFGTQECPDEDLHILWVHF